MPIIKVQANWDPEAAVWVATSDDVPGLVTEADNSEELIEKLRVLIPELLRENRGEITDHQIPFKVLSERTEVAVC